MYKFDLKSGYHHIDICQPDQQFLGFQWALGGAKNRYFCVSVLLFYLLGFRLRPTCLRRFSAR